MRTRIVRLENQLQQDLTDEEKIDLLNTISWHYRILDLQLLENYATQALQLARSIGYRKGIAFSKINFSFKKYFEANIEESTRITHEALQIFEELNETAGKAHAFTLLGVSFWAIGQYEKGFNYVLRGNSCHEEVRDHEGLAWNHYALGGLYADLHNYGHALDYYRKAMEVFEQIGEKIGLSSVFSGIGNIYQAMGKYELALERYTHSLEMANETQARQFKARALNDLGVLYELMGNTPTALACLEESLLIRQAIGNLQGIVSTQINLAKVYMQLGDYVQAVSFLEQAEIQARMINAKPKLLRIHQLLANVYKKRFEPWNALEHYEQHLQMKVEVLGEENTIQLKNLESAFNIEKAERETEIYRLKNIELAEANAQIRQKQAELERLNAEIRAHNGALQRAFAQIERMNQDLIDSIQYAQRIQKAILATPEHFHELFPDGFLFFQPKDIVSGDFYWFSKVEKRSAFQRTNHIKVLIAADCTGHGVPGAFMTVMGNDLLNEIVNNRKITSPEEILQQLHEKVLLTLQHQDERNQVNDGMDMAIIAIDERHRKLRFAGAKLPLYFVRKDTTGTPEIFTVKGSKFPIGHLQHEGEKKFQMHEINFEPGDIFYLFSDGFQDQFGQEDNRKFMKKNFRNLLLDISQLPVEKQQERLKVELDLWRGSNPQTDDVMVIGVRM